MLQLQEVYEKYKNFDFIGYYNEIVQNNTNNKYSKGGLSFPAGIYAPSYVQEMRIGNCNVGKEIKNIKNGYDFKYYFDENNRIILSEKYGEFGLGALNFYFYSGNVCEYVHFVFAQQKIYSISKSYYDDSGRIVRHIQIDALYFGFDEAYQYEEHLFRYDNDDTYITHNKYSDPIKMHKMLKKLGFKNIEESTGINSTNMMIKENILYYLNEEGNVTSFYPIRFKLVDGKKVEVPLPKKIPVFKIIKENMIKILSKWENIDKSVIWILCESTDLSMQYTTLKEDGEEKWNIAFYNSEEEEIFIDKSHIQAFEDLLFNSGCDIDDLIDGDEYDYFKNKMIKIIKELRKEGYLKDETAVIISTLEISNTTFDIAKKINKKEVIKGFLESF